MFLLLLRLIMRLLGANPEAGFTELIYGVSAFFLAPFQGIFPTPIIEGAVFELSTLFAIIIYGLLGWIAGSFFHRQTVENRESVVVRKDT